MRRLTARPLSGLRCDHAEGPVFDPLSGELLWVDIPAGRVHVGGLDGVPARTYDTGDAVGAVVPCRDPARGWVVASRYGFAALARSGEVTPLAEPERDASPPTRMNDGKCDPFGGFWAGSMGLDDALGAGTLHHLAADGTCRPVLTGVSISNGLAWRDDAHLYYVDTPTRRVDLLTVTADGTVTDRSVAFPVPAELGHPDGLTIDTEGRLWIALWGGGAVACFAPSGELLTLVDVDATQVSCCVFAGPDLATLVITTSQEGFTQERSSAEPHAGHLFVADVVARGLAPYRYGP